VTRKEEHAMHRTSRIATALLLAGATLSPAGLPVRASGARVACTLTTLEALVREVGGDRFEPFSLSAGDQDPHFVSPTPLLMKRVREAELMLEIGMQLELWGDEVANGSGNPRIFRGGPGRIAVSTGIPKLEVPATISRAQGDVHPEGNPHLWLDPVRTKLLARNVAAALKSASPADAPHVEERLHGFEERIDRALFGEALLGVVGSPKLSRLTLDGTLHAFLEDNEYGGKKLSELAGGWLAKSRPLRGQKVVEFHKVWSYFASTFGFRLVGTIEEKPGIAPGPRHVAETIELIGREGVELVLVDNLYDPALARRIAREAGARVVVLPNQVRGEPGVEDYFALIDRVLEDMLAAPAPAPAGGTPR
jgi:ABC-type Zn uptake system ZnuABC Zn-binding protein ZnuA